MNVHFHVLWTDGVFAHEPGRGRAEFCEHGEVGDADVVRLVRTIRDRVQRCLRRRGKLPVAGDEALDAADGGVDLLAELSAASVQGRTALGERAGERDQRPGRGTRHEPFAKGALCAELDGYSLHAAVRVEARDRDRLEHLCRYAGRPAIAAGRLVELADGRVAYTLKRRWKDGTTAVVMGKQVLMERLCALVPAPRRHLVTYHGVFGPAAGIRDQVVPQVEAGEGDDADVPGGGRCDEPVGIERRPQVVPHAPRKRRRGPPRRYPWADLLRRVFGTEVLVCPRCGGRRKVLAAIHDPESIRKVLGVMGLSSEVPGFLPARSPPRQGELEFGG